MHFGRATLSVAAVAAVCAIALRATCAQLSPVYGPAPAHCLLLAWLLFALATLFAAAGRPSGTAHSAIAVSLGLALAAPLAFATLSPSSPIPSVLNVLFVSGPQLPNAIAIVFATVPSMVPLGLFLGGEFRVAKKYFLASGALVAIFAAWAFSVEEFGVRTFERYVSAVDELVYTLWIDLLKLESGWIHPALVLCALSFAWLSVAVVSGYRRWDIVILILSICLGQLLLIPQCSSLIIPEPTSKGQTVLAKAYSNTGYISVVEDPTIHGGIRVLRADHSVIGGIFLAEGYGGDSIYGSFYFLSFLTGFERKSFSSLENAKESMQNSNLQILNIGLGIGIASATLHNSYPNARIDVVELDPKVLGFAVEYFGFPNVTGKTNLVAADGRAFLEHSESGKYDYVLHDVFTNGGVGGRLISFEALSQVRRVLVDDGILALNFAGNMNSVSTRSVTKTLKEVFPHVTCYTERAVNASDLNSFHNMVFFASTAPLTFNSHQIASPPGLPNPKKKTTSNGQSLGYMRARMLDQFPTLRHDAVLDTQAGHVLRDSWRGLNSSVQIALEMEEARNRQAHWKVMNELFGLAFWEMF
ncbi:hypothetical protein HDU82_007389 [Entophlyctis luteolus]|nr:hypothetical protein HDU82_007389 [Entophlyctis luteolus]